MMMEQSVTNLDSSRTVGRKPSKPSTAHDSDFKWVMQHMPPAVCDIEQLLGWTYARQQAHRNEKFGVSGGPAGYVDSIVKCERNANMGGLGANNGSYTPLMSFAGGGDLDMIHPAALIVHGAVGIMDDLSVGLVIQHGWQCTRPDWGGPLKLLRPLKNIKGKVKMAYDNSNKPIASLLAPDEIDHNESVFFMRRVYTHWWEALLILREECQRRLPDLTITGPSAPEIPWEIAALVIKWLDARRK